MRLQDYTIRLVNIGIAIKNNGLPSKVEKNRGNIIGVSIGQVSYLLMFKISALREDAIKFNHFT